MTASMLRVISLGAGVQSTTMALMAAHGEIGPMPDAAIFADTGDEPEAVYEHLRWLTSPNVLPFPVYTTSGGNLFEALKSGDDAARIPAYVGAGGLSTRQCTRNFKIRPIRRKVRDLLGVGPRGRVRPGQVEQWIGISTDEVVRATPSGVAFIRNRHPLLETGKSRSGCLEWLDAHGYPRPPKSSCVYCGFRTNAGWRQVRRNPADWQKACAADAWLRQPEQIARFRGELFLHRSKVPLAEADLGIDEPPQFGGSFAHDCGGNCGL